MDSSAGSASNPGLPIAIANANWPVLSENKQVNPTEPALDRVTDQSLIGNRKSAIVLVNLDAESVGAFEECETQHTGNYQIEVKSQRAIDKHRRQVAKERKRKR
jgi:hypothetical protein